MRSRMSFVSMIVVVILLYVGMAAVAATAGTEVPTSVHAQGNPLSAVVIIQPMSQLAVACTDGMVLQTLDGPEAMIVRCVRPTPTPTPTPAPTATPRRGNG